MPNEAGEVEGQEEDDSQSTSFTERLLAVALIAGVIMIIAFLVLTPVGTCGYIDGTYKPQTYKGYLAALKSFLLWLGGVTLFLCTLWAGVTVFLRKKSRRFQADQWYRWFSTVNIAFLVAFLMITLYGNFQPRIMPMVICDDFRDFK